MRIIDSANTRTVKALLNRRPARDPRIARRVSRIIERVRADGDAALLGFARRFDRLDEPIDVSRMEMVRAARSLDPRSPIRDPRGGWPHPTRRQKTAAHGLECRPFQRHPHHPARRPAGSCRMLCAWRPLSPAVHAADDRHPGAVAGVREVIAVCPGVDRTIMAAALEAGVTRLLRVGGAHAIAALAYGTRTIPRVDKIVGPGNAYVAAAKAAVAADCAIDFFAGPSEIAVVSTVDEPGGLPRI